MRTIMTRSAQKKQVTEPQPITKRPISKVSKATDAASKATMRVTRKQSAASSAEQSAAQSRAPSAIKQSKVIKTKPVALVKNRIQNPARPNQKLPQSSQTPTLKCKLTRVTSDVAPNPESPTHAAKVKTSKLMQHRGSQFAALDTTDLQSQEDSTSFEVQSTRGACEMTADKCPSLVTEFEGLAKFGSLASSQIQRAAVKTSNVLSKLKSSDVELNNSDKHPTVDQPKSTNPKTLPSVQIKMTLHQAEELPTEPQVVEERMEDSVQVPAQVMAVEPVDPNFCNIEETIDECERRIKAEESRYASLVARRHLYEQWMYPSEFKLLMRESASRLVNFDPVFDLPCSAYPLPRPWDQIWQSKTNQHHQAPAYYPDTEFAYPRAPRRAYN